jgi:hypothetical protein
LVASCIEWSCQKNNPAHLMPKVDGVMDDLIVCV